jgi:arylsulfatase A-like enzyme
MGLYAAMIAHLDQALGRLLDRFAEEARPVAVVFLSDNGPEGNDVMAIADNATWVPATFDLSYDAMGTKGSYVALGRGWGHVSAGPLNRYKSFLSEGGTRTPAILSYPGVVPAGLASDALVSITDLLPTLVAWAGGEVPQLAGVPIDTERLIGAPRGQPLAMEIYGNRAVWEGPWKALWDFSTDHWQLFHLPSDPGEQRDRSGEEPARVAEMVAIWERFAEENQVFRFPRETGYGRYPDQRVGDGSAR